MNCVYLLGTLGPCIGPLVEGTRGEVVGAGATGRLTGGVSLGRTGLAGLVVGFLDGPKFLRCPRPLDGPKFLRCPRPLDGPRFFLLRRFLLPLLIIN